MAHHCPDCMQTFESRVSNCPLCGYSIVSDDRPEEEYIRLGYTRFRVGPRRTAAPTPAPAPVPAPTPASVESVHINDDDILQQIRKGYTTYRNDVDRPEPTPTPPPTPKPAPAPTPEPRPSGDTRQPQSNNDFFGSFTSNRLNTPEPQPEPEPAPTPAPSPTPANRGGYDDSGNRNGNYYTPARHSFGVRSFFNGLGRFLAAVPWRVIFYLVIAAAVIFGIYTLWQMRYVILESIMSFIVALIPLGLIVVGIVALIRSMFR